MAPLPKFGLQLKDWTSEGSRRFLQAIPSTEQLEEAARFIIDLLYPHETTIPDIASVTFIITSNRVLKSFQAIAYQCENDLDDSHREIHIYSKWLEELDETAYQFELLGVIRHELVHCFQPVPHASVPPGLIEGIADWVRLRSGLGREEWKASSEGRWDQGYDHTAYFLEYLSRRFDDSVVVGLNQRTFSGEIDDGLWAELCGEKIDRLWIDYGASLKSTQH
ncbi:hypothetical protein IFR04_002766 [Cadophora malorum]|uniref:Uncharacterized protein n=1 Tax=Cadophora malorum TaxID=108018 RepID=A0A8H8BU05_9HELO|nr:hypothetical protein IFR04_002766 [Cadophora malorum]